MKKAFLVLACVCFAVAATSCKKDCRCISTYDGKEMSNAVVGQMSKSDCEAYKLTVGEGYKFECKAE